MKSKSSAPELLTRFEQELLRQDLKEAIDYGQKAFRPKARATTPLVAKDGLSSPQASLGRDPNAQHSVRGDGK